MFNKKEEPEYKYIVTRWKGIDSLVAPELCYTLQDVGKLLFDYPNLYGKVYEIGREIKLEVNLSVWEK